MKENPSTVRSRKYRESLKEDPQKLEEYREKERLRQKNLREKSKGSLNVRQLDDQRFNARLRQQKCRRRKKEKEQENSKRDNVNKKARSKHNRRTGEIIKKLEEQIKTLKNSNRKKNRVIRKMKTSGHDADSSSCSISTVLNVSNKDLSDSDSVHSEEFRQIPQEDASSPNAAMDAAAILYQALSPRTKRKTLKRLNSSDQFKSNKLVLRKSGIRPERQKELFKEGNEQQKKVKEFLERDDNSATCPDKQKKGTRYRLALLKVLHEKYCSEFEDISFSYFCKLIPSGIVKPKPEDWGTCLCKICINPELKLAALAKFDAGSKRTIDQFSDDHQEVKTFIKDTTQRLNGMLEKPIEFVEWKQEKERTVNPDETVKNSYFSRKSVEKVKLKDFLELLEKDLVNYVEHITRAIAQFRKIKKVKSDIECDDKQAMVRLDWSENLVLFQTRQEKGAYYTEIQVSLHPFVVYQNKDSSVVISSYCGISDYTNHRAPATWVSLERVLSQMNDKITDVTIVSDSPTSQYRNKYMMWYIQSYAIKKDMKLTWVYTEAGHGKGPADGIGSCVKNMVTKDIVALNPD